MTQTPGDNSTPTVKGHRRSCLGSLIRTLLVLGVLLAGAGGAGLWWLWRYVQTDLTPQVETQLGKILDRPVEIGEIERITPFGITFGRSRLPATPTELDTAETRQVEVGFNPLQLLQTGGRLDLDVTLVEPDLYLEQDQSGEWVATQLNLEPGNGPLQIKLDELKLRRGKVIAVPYGAQGANPGEAIALDDVQGVLKVREDGKLLKFEADGQVVGQAGRLRTEGESKIPAPSPNASAPNASTDLPQSAKSPSPGPRLNFDIQGKNLLLSDVKRLLDKTVQFPEVTFDQGRVDADLKIGYVPNQPVEIAGTIDFNQVIAKVPQLPQPVKNAQGKLTIKNQAIQLLSSTGNYGPLELQAQGLIHLENGLNLTAQVKPVEAPKVLDLFQVKLPVTVAGMAIAEDLKVTGQPERPIITGKVKNLRTLTVDKVPFAAASSRFQWQGSTLSLSEIRAEPSSGGLITGSGQVITGPSGGIAIDTNATGLQGDDLVQLYSTGSLPFAIGPITAQARVFGPLEQPRTTIQFQALESTYPARGKAVLEKGTLQVQDLLLRVAEGTVRGQGSWTGDRFSGTANLSGLQLTQFSEQLRGSLNGDVLLSGPVQGFNLNRLEAKGLVTFSQGIALVSDPLTANFRWDGARSQIIVASATAPGLEASGIVQAAVADTPTVTGLNLAVSARGFDVQSLPFASAGNLPVALDLGGFANFEGRVQGPLEALRAQGTLALREFRVNNLPFESSLDGRISYAPEGVVLNVAGDRDRINLDLDSQFQPRSFLVQQGEAIARGNRTGDDQYAIKLDEFSLAAFNLRPSLGLGDVALQGVASGNATVQLNPLTARGNLRITNPALGTLKGTAFSGDFSLANNVARLENAALTQDLCKQQQGDRCLEPVQTRYRVEKGEVVLGKDPKFDLAIAIDNGDIQGLLRMVQWFEFGDVAQGLIAPTYAKGADLSVNSVGLSQASLLNQLRRFAEIEQLVAQEKAQQRNEARIPSLVALQGQFGGRVEASGSLQSGIQSTFKIQGQDWAWGQYDIDSVQAEGEFADGVLTLLPVRVTDGDAAIAFSGQLGGDRQSGQLRASQVPLSLARNFIDLPVDLDGEMDLSATVSGSADNPQAVGSLNLTNGKLNGTRIETQQAGFNYVNARLSFRGALSFVDDPLDPSLDPQINSPVASGTPPSPPTTAAEREPVRISGSIPYALPFSQVQPDSDQLALTLDVKNEGLAFLNLLTRDQVRWLQGQGEIQMQVAGTLSEPIATGSARFEDAVLAAQFLPDELLTGVTGLVRFNQDRVRVDGLQADFSNGKVQAEGTIPIARSDIQTNDPLKVNFRELALNLRGLYRGGASGDVQINGSVLSPDLAGQILLTDGQVLLPDPSVAAAQEFDSVAPTDGIQIGSGEIPIRVPSFNGLQLVLGQNVRVAAEPVFSFFAEGDLGLTGDLTNPRLEGAILLTKGQVNLFTTRFTLARRARNVAIFDPDQGLDPELQLQLVAAVTEVSRRRSLFDNTSTSEISDEIEPGDFGSLQTVRVRAQVNGSASSLLDNITLSSSPARTQSEIVSLIGGGFVDTLGRGGDSTLALANLAGSALLGNLQAAINNALSGPVEVRLFPAIVDSQKQRNQVANGDDKQKSVFALGGEIGINITNSVSFSALKLLTVDLPAQFSLRYQLNDNLTLRGTTDLQGENRALVEYEARF